MSNNNTEQQQHNAYTAPVASIDIYTGVTEGNPALDNSKTTNNSNNSTTNENEETMSQFSLICVVFCEALVSSCAFTAFPDKPSTTRWLVFASFYFGQLVSTPLVARFSHLFSRRLLVITGLAGLFAGQAFYALANSLPLWAAARAISGFFAGTAAFARASLSTPHDWKRLLVCAGLVSSSGSVIGISFCMCLQTLLVGNENTDTQPFYTFLADFPQAPIGFLTGFFVLIALVFAVLFTRNSTAEEEEEEHKQESTATTAVKPVRLAVVGGFVFVAALFARVYSGTLFSAWIVSEDGLGFDSNDGGILCIQFMIASAVIHAAMLFFCTNSINILWIMRVASLVYAATLCCMPCAMLIVDNHGAWAVWMFVIVVRTVSDAAMLAAMCCSYILITLCVSQKRLLSANTLAQGATALLYSTVPLGVNKVVTLAELPCNYNSATYYLLFVIGAVASLLELFGTFFTSGAELDKCKNKGKQGRIEQIEMQPVK